jgi:hypothetical protein
MAFALNFLGRAWEARDPAKAMQIFERGLGVALEARVVFASASLAVSAARVEASHGDPGRALDLYVDAIEGMCRSGDISNVAAVTIVFASVASTFERLGRHRAAASLYGVIGHLSQRALEVRPELVESLREELGATEFERCAASGAAMEVAEAVRFMRSELEATSKELSRTS